MVTRPAATALTSPRAVRAKLGVSRERMARVMDVSAKTIERWEQRDVAPDNRGVKARLAALDEIADLGLRVYSFEGFRQFMTAPMPEFDGHTAMQLVELGQEKRVLAALASDYEGQGF